MLHLQQAAQRIVTVMHDNLAWRAQLQLAINQYSVAAFGNDSKLEGLRLEQPRQVYLVVMDKGFDQMLILTQYGHAIAVHDRNGLGVNDREGAGGIPDQRRIAGQRGFFKHLQGPSPVNPHYHVLVLRHACDQGWHHLVDYPLTFLRAMKHR